MCGIAGIVAVDGLHTDEPARAVRMRDVLTHRGPDGAGLYADTHALLGHRRLSIVDLAGGHQPLANEDETIVDAYEQWGDECVHRFRGMFAFAIWDARRRRLLLVRDRLGVKPLYWALVPATAERGER